MSQIPKRNDIFYTHIRDIVKSFDNCFFKKIWSKPKTINFCQWHYEFVLLFIGGDGLTDIAT
jgi:hypothetical protein